MLARWLSVLETYDFSIEHRPGRYHCNADSLSRRPVAYCKRDDCPDCHFEKLSQEKIPITKDSEKSVKNRVSPIWANQSDTTESTGASNSEPADREPMINWLQTWTPDELRSWQQSERSIKQIVNLKEKFIHKPPRHEVLDATPELKTLWGM